MMTNTITQYSRKMLFSGTARNVYWSLIGNGFYTLFTFVFLVLIVARILGPENFGRFNALFAFIILLADITDLGIGPSLSRFIPSLLKKSKNTEVEAITRTAFQFETVLAVFFTIAFIGFASILSMRIFDGTDIFLVRIASLGIVGMVLTVFSVFVLSAREQFKDVATINILLSASRIILALVFVSFNAFTLLTALISLIAPPFFVWLFSLRYMPTSFLSIKREGEIFKKLLSFSKFVGINKIFTAVSSRLDVLMLIALAGAFESGIYSAAVRITQIYPLVAGSLLAVFAPRFSVYDSSKQAWDFTKKTLLVTVGLLGSIVVLFIIAQPFILLVFGAEYESSIPVFKALLLPMVFFVMQLPLSGLVIYTLKKPQIFAVSAIVQLIIIFSSNLVFIPRFGVFGPVFGLSFGYLGAFVTLLVGFMYFKNKTV